MKVIVCWPDGVGAIRVLGPFKDEEVLIIERNLRKMHGESYAFNVFTLLSVGEFLP